MATSKPLALKREKYDPKVTPVVAASAPRATVLVMVPTGTIADTWDYLIPEELSNLVTPGTLVRVPFGSKPSEGIVIARGELESEEALKFIDAAISTIPQLTQNQIEFLPHLVGRYACNASDFFSSIVPPFSKSGEKAAHIEADIKPAPLQLTRALRLIGAQSNLFLEIRSAISTWGSKGKVTIILPEQHQLELLEELLKEDGLAPRILHAALPKSQRYQKYLEANHAMSGVTLALRNGVFLSSGASDLLVVVDDLAHMHYDGRAPMWNSRDIALLRSSQTNLLFLDYSPSLELVRLVDSGWLPVAANTAPNGSSRDQSILKNQNRKKIVAAERSPESSYHSVLSEAVKSGSVLIIYNSKGFINSFTCSQCRNIALCDCGGKLTLNSLTDIPQCSLCLEKAPQWKCRWCASVRPRIAAKGLHYSAKELAASFPRVSIAISTAEHRILRAPEGRHIIIATAGCEPFGEYSAVVYLNADRDFASASMRSQERTRAHWARLLTLLRSDGTFYLEMSPTHAAIADLRRGDLLEAARREIAERDELHLPPHFRLVALSASESELRRIQPLLATNDLSFVGPFAVGDRSRLVLKLAMEQASSAISLINSANKVQAAKGRELISIHTDPSEM